jgi:hypothetical protein
MTRRCASEGSKEKDLGFALRSEFFDGDEAVVHSLVFIAILAGNIIFGNFVRANFAFVVSVLHALYDFGFESVTFFEQFVHALGIRAFEAGQSLQISGLPPRAR